MIILSKKTINPHIKLHALSMPPISALPDTPLQRLNLLALTRQFDAINEAVKSNKDMQFPNLADSTNADS